jgi:hypothetical protein
MDVDLLMEIPAKLVEMGETGQVLVEILQILEMVELVDQQFSDLIIV